MDRGILSKFQDRSVDTRRGPGWVGGPSGRSGTGRGNLEKVWDGLGDAPKGTGRVGDHRGGPGWVV